MLATRISFMNMLSQLTEKTGANILEVRRGMGSDKRIGLSFLWAGCGFGGSCFPKDLLALRSTLSEHEIPTKLLDAVIEINQAQKELLFSKVASYFSHRGGLEGRVIAVLGLAFKPETDDIREAPSITLIQDLLQSSCSVRLYDPIAQNNMKKLFPENASTIYCSSEIDAVTGADAVVVATEWKQFRMLDLANIKKHLRGNLFVDGRNQYSPEECLRHGFSYASIGRATDLYAAITEEAYSLEQR
jgi:UDPglucose 6-dehydrogenase